jgi:hypothetical protein
MNVQLDLIKPKDLEPKEEVFYVRCRAKTKQLLALRMQANGFNSMSDWFDQWVPVALQKTGAKNAVSNKRHPPRRSKSSKKTRNL